MRSINPAKLRMVFDALEACGGEAATFARSRRRQYMPRIERAEIEQRAEQRAHPATASRGGFRELIEHMAAM
ncbi:hypothetical protein [uncultured Rhodoblastus sp.]|uniref:hypothetical protein n=1 Tax=uncultured Rhodoblastus sp. TaxID=543037 RepID=UPI0025EF2A22|nr:hypothetical protein [uncultured Rhodoblastus sp.]